MAYNPFGYPASNQYIPSGTSDITGVRWVASIDEVNAASIPWGSQIFMDQNRDVFYIKSQSGQIRSFSFEEIEPPKPETYVTRSEYEDLRSKYEQLVRELDSEPVVQHVESDAGNAADAQLYGNPGAGQAAVLQPDSGYGVDQIAAQQPVG